MSSPDAPPWKFCTPWDLLWIRPWMHDFSDHLSADIIKTLYQTLCLIKGIWKDFFRILEFFFFLACYMILLNYHYIVQLYIILIEWYFLMEGTISCRYSLLYTSVFLFTAKILQSTHLKGRIWIFRNLGPGIYNNSIC